MGLRSLLNKNPKMKQGQVNTTVQQQGPMQPLPQAPSAATKQGPVGFDYGNVFDRTLGPGNIQSGSGFFNASRGLAREELQKGITDESQQSQALRGAAGSAILSRMADLQDNAAVRRNLTNAQLDRALNRNLASARRQFAGTGLAGTSQGGRSLGELLRGAQQANVDAEIALQDQSLRELLGLTEAGGAAQQQELLARQQQFAQQQALADLLNNQANTEIQRDMNLASSQPGGPSLLETLGVSAGGIGLGALTGGLGAGAAGSIFPALMGGAAGGGGGGGGASPAQGIANLMSGYGANPVMFPGVTK